MFTTTTKVGGASFVVGGDRGAQRAHHELRYRRKMRSVVALVACLGCGRLGFDATALGGPDATIDAPVAPPDGEFPTGLFGARVEHTELDAGPFQDDVTLSDDMLEIYFAVASSPTAPADIYRATRTTPTGAFAPPTPVTELNTTAHEGSVWLSADGLSMLFTTDRAGVANDYDIWTAQRTSRSSPWVPGAIR